MSASRSRVLKFRAVGWIVVVSMLVLAVGGPSAAGVAAKDTPGNIGTVKIHDGAGEPSPEVKNQPHVCTFHMHFFFGDAFQSGSWEIQRWAPGPKGQVVLAGTYSDTDGDGEDREPDAGAYSLPDGHYKLFWDGDTGKHDKHKVFWVKCAQASQSPSPSPTASPTGTVVPTASPTGTVVPTASPTGTVVPTASPTGTVVPTASASASPSPTGSSASETGSPEPTLPPTDILAGEAQPSPDSWRLMLFAIAGLLAGILVLTPSRKVR